MPYEVQITDGTVITTIPDNTLDNTTTLTLFGKGYSGYGEILIENLIKLLENSASSAQPTAPLRGELWFDTTTNQIKVFDGTSFKPTGGAKAQATQPSSPSAGDLWADTDDDQLYLYTGSGWQLVGPVYSKGQTTSGFKIETINDNSAISRVIASMYSGNTRVAILSASGFTPGAPITGFATIYAGITLNSALGAQFVGTTTAATQLDTSASYSNSGDLIAGKNFMRKDVAQTTQGAITIATDNGLILGTGSDLRLTVSGIDATIANASEDGDLSVSVNDGGAPTTAIKIDASSSYMGIWTDSPTVPLEITGNVKITGNLSVSGEYNNTTSTINVIDDNWVKLNTGNAQADAGIIAETDSLTDDARLFWSPSNNYWAAGSNASYSQIIRLADAVTDGDANKEKVLKTTAAGNVKVTSLTLGAVGANISTADTSNLNVPTTGQVAESIKRWGGSVISDDGSNSIAGRRYVETAAPTSGQGSDGDLWFVREA